MKSRPHDASRLDVQRFAHDEASIGGQWQLASLARLASSVPDTPAGTVVSWQASGRMQPAASGMTGAALQVRAGTLVRLQCQRCLEALDEPLEVDRLFRFAHDEAAAQHLDEQYEDDVLALTHALDLRSLVEDELLLALPLVPRHAHCRMPASLDPQEPAPADAQPHPFAGLATLKTKRSGS